MQRVIGYALIVIGCLASIALCVVARGAEPERIEDILPPAVAMTVDVDADGNLAAIRVLDPDGKLVAVLRPDGTVETDRSTEEAARGFWYALSGYVKQCSKL